ncbi:transposase [Halanaeroarchaeum sulfurireducens]|uniref:Transposase IS4 family protein n=1 Tax=Halanaeroarchaeum sulfurireducens TaxID=1604004 RepID=A0A0F7PBF6_9EURY|nr:transposase [Halanaeroarchaeum sulfurireducens]AKH97505.1 transposase IS4 family protein [Halanaeroarchaeum sulfurireducens]
MNDASSTTLPGLDARQQVAALLDEADESDIDTVRIATSIDVSPIVREGIDGGDRSPFSAESMVRAHLYRHLRGLDFIQDLSDGLQDTPSTARKLGFDPAQIPDRSVLSRWWNEYFISEARDTIESAAEEIVEYIHDQALPLDTAAYEPDPPSGESSRTKKRRKKQKRKEVLQNTRDWLYSGIELHREGPTRYSDNDYLDLLAHLGLENSFANNGAEGFKDEVADIVEEDDPSVPTGDSLIHHLRKFDPDELFTLFDELNDRLFQVAKEHGLFDKPVDLAIDENAVPFYGDRNLPMVTNIKPKAGTSYGYKFATICIVGDHGRRFTLGVVPVTNREEMRASVLDLIERAEEHVTVKQVYMDRGYYDTQLVVDLQRAGYPFIIRAQITKKSKELWENRPEDKDVNFELGSTMERKTKPYAKTKVNRIVAAGISEDDSHIAFITNRAITQESAEQIVEDYRDRWGSETSFRVAGDFRAKTTSKSYAVRVFYYLFSMLLYNVYILTNAVVRQALGIPPSDTPPITAKDVLRELRRFFTPPPSP